MPIILPKKPKSPAPKAEPKVCEFCKHTYMQPCNGVDEACPNRLHLIAKGE